MNITAIIITGFTMGILGSLHCAGMCGPIALTLSNRFEGQTSRFSNIFLYNSGRSMSYALMGLLLGFIGNRFALAGYQQILSIAAGVLIIAILSAKTFLRSSFHFFSSWNDKIKQLLSKTLNSPGSALYQLEVGAINAWLPCGLVYLALASALATANTWSGALFMLCFGFGTTPMMAGIMLAGNYLSFSFRQKLLRLVPLFVFATACLLILRGMNLGIPYISPSVDVVNQYVRSCCHK